MDPFLSLTSHKLEVREVYREFVRLNPRLLHSSAPRPVKAAHIMFSWLIVELENAPQFWPNSGQKVSLKRSLVDGDAIPPQAIVQLIFRDLHNAELDCFCCAW